MRRRWSALAAYLSAAVMLGCCLLANCQARAERAISVGCPGGTCPPPQIQSPTSPARVAPPQAQTAHPATCRIRNQQGRMLEYGSGTLVDKNEKWGLVVTCQHLFRDTAGTITCQFPEGAYTAKLLNADPHYELAMLLVSAPDAEPVEVSLTPAARGDAVFGCGYGSDGRYRATAGTVLGYVQTGDTGASETLQWSGAQRQGDSGGPVFDRQGKLVAVLWGTDNTRSVGTYAVRVDKFLLTAGRYLLPWNARNNNPRYTPPGSVPPSGPPVQSPSVDLTPVGEKLDRIAGLLEQMNRPAAPTPENTPLVPVAPDTTAEDALAAARDAQATAGQAADVAATLADEERGPLARLRQRIEAAKAEGAEGAAAIARSVATGLLTSYGIPAGIAVLLLGFVVWDIRKKLSEGDPLLVEKVAARVHQRLGPLRERVVERVGDVRERIHDRLNPGEDGSGGA